MCQDSQECFDFLCWHQNFPQRSYPKLQFLTQGLVGTMLEMGYKIRKVYFTTLPWTPTLCSLSIWEEYTSVIYPECLSLKALQCHLCSAMLEVGNLQTAFPRVLVGSCLLGSLETGRDGDRMKALFLFSDPVRHFPEVRQLWFQPPASLTTPSTCCVRCLTRSTCTARPLGLSSSMQLTFSDLWHISKENPQWGLSTSLGTPHWISEHWLQSVLVRSWSTGTRHNPIRNMRICHTGIRLLVPEFS